MSQLYLVVITMDWFSSCFSWSDSKCGAGGSFFFTMLVLDWNVDKLLKSLKTNIALGYEGQPEDVANLVSFLVSEKAGYITGQAVSFFHWQIMKNWVCPSQLDTNRWRVVYELKQHVRSAAQISVMITAVRPISLAIVIYMKTWIVISISSGLPTSEPRNDAWSASF